MGWHWVSLGGNHSLTKDNFFPIVPMYWEGKLNAIFFSSFTVQQTHNGTEWQSNGWDPSPIPMCNNMCDKNCVLEPLGMASTMHWFFHPRTENANVICPVAYTVGIPRCAVALRRCLCPLLLDNLELG
mmetsp:Transcript_45648/g.127285  ORF Transcript_45648/g.127285 Transcript_45648/m.127285 type:complete len:128 (+) Transcript_45648:673-1056(+)